MKDIKTREHDRKPKILEKASRMPKELAREAGLAAKEKSLQGSRVSDTADHPDSPVGYAGDKVEAVQRKRTGSREGFLCGREGNRQKDLSESTEAYRGRKREERDGFSFRPAA